MSRKASAEMRGSFFACEGRKTPDSGKRRKLHKKQLIRKADTKTGGHRPYSLQKTGTVFIRRKPEKFLLFEKRRVKKYQPYCLQNDFQSRIMAWFLINKKTPASPAKIYKYESLLKLNSRAQDAVAKEELQVAQGSSMSVLSEEYQDIVLDALQLMRDFHMAGVRDEVQELVDYIKNHEGEPITAEEGVRSICGTMGTYNTADPDGAPDSVAPEGEGDAGTDGEDGYVRDGTVPSHAGKMEI